MAGESRRSDRRARLRPVGRVIQPRVGDIGAQFAGGHGQHHAAREHRVDEGECVADHHVAFAPTGPRPDTSSCPRPSRRTPVRQSCIRALTVGLWRIRSNRRSCGLPRRVLKAAWVPTNPTLVIPPVNGMIQNQPSSTRCTEMQPAMSPSRHSTWRKWANTAAVLLCLSARLGSQPVGQERVAAGSVEHEARREAACRAIRSAERSRGHRRCRCPLRAGPRRPRCVRSMARAPQRRAFANSALSNSARRT